MSCKDKQGFTTQKLLKAQNFLKNYGCENLFFQIKFPIP